MSRPIGPCDSFSENTKNNNGSAEMKRSDKRVVFCPRCPTLWFMRRRCMKMRTMRTKKQTGEMTTLMRRVVQTMSERSALVVCTNKGVGYSRVDEEMDLSSNSSGRKYCSSPRWLPQTNGGDSMTTKNLNSLCLCHLSLLCCCSLCLCQLVLGKNNQCDGPRSILQ